MENGDITLEQDDFTKQYAIFKRVKYPSGTTAFWQQCTKWYWYKKCCEKAYEKTLDK